ncbi:copper homeostasis protein CutC [Olegusella massiliensis]|uniref:copper homeostasis protein CutC n=1 Tax=Olegusella massiliensis TaxID=1776381 RepID=UPI0023F6EDBB|nr:copper homeostasis protein CutC [Olegusella massiliensis]
MPTTVEICTGSYEDCLSARDAGADRVELNSALWLGGLTPSLGTLRLVRTALDIPIITMLRPRGAGFCYSPHEVEVMFADASAFMDAGADGVAFGFLNPDATINVEQTRLMVELAHSAGKEAVFHRAFDVTPDPKAALELLVDCGVDRILTSGQKPSAHAGATLIAQLQKQAAGRIQILAGAGINAQNVCELINKTGISQVHASCRDYEKDPTTTRNEVSYAYLEGDLSCSFDCVSKERAQALTYTVHHAEVQASLEYSSSATDSSHSLLEFVPGISNAR